MSEEEKSLQNFLQRWSRRKLAATERGEPAKAQPEGGEAVQPGAPAEPPRDAAAALFDVESLPPIETINAASDIRAFLAPGVPIELMRAALRRAWTSDPVIHDFIGIAENQWDFTEPDSVHGFGTLDPTPALRRMAADLLGDPSGDAANAGGRHADAGAKAEISGETAPTGRAAAALPAEAATSPVAAGPQLAEQSDTAAASQHDVASAEHNSSPPEPARRPQGGALPK